MLIWYILDLLDALHWGITEPLQFLCAVVLPCSDNELGTAKQRL